MKFALGSRTRFISRLFFLLEKEKKDEFRLHEFSLRLERFRAAENLERPRRTSLLSGERLSISRDWTLGLSIGNRDKIWELFVRLGNFIVAWKIFRFFFLLPNF